MSPILKRVYAGTAVVGLSVYALGALWYVAGARLNTTKSIPVGLYWASSAPIEKGEYVAFCPPEGEIFAEAKERGYITAGFCPGGYGYMMKRILAAKGDTLSVTSAGVLVNGHLLPYSTPREADLAGRPLPHFEAESYTLTRSEVLLMSDVSSTSFDGRYFGPINRSQIKTVIQPVFTW